MAYDIGPKIGVEGEKAFRDSLKAVNEQIKALGAEMASVTAAFSKGGDAEEAAAAKNDVLGRSAAAAVQKLMLLDSQLGTQREKLRALGTALEEAKAQFGANSAEAVKAQNAYNRQSAAVSKLERDYHQTTAQVRNMENAMEDTGDAMDGAGDAMAGAGEKAGNLFEVIKAAGAAAILREIVAAFRACADASMEFETAMAGVSKVAKMSDTELAGMETAIKQLSTSMPATTTEIAQVVEASLRLGIAKESVMGFAATMLDLGNVSDLSSEAAATALARFANIAGTAAEDYGRLGSTIVALGNNFATSESEITNMASRLASAGTLAGLTEAQIMGLSAALSSVGIEAEAGGTAMTQTLAAMEKAVTSGGAKLEQFARIAGMSSQSFSEAWKNDPVTAIQAFIGGLGRLDEQGESATLVLDELGLSGVRQSNMLKSLSLAYETLDAAMATANQAWAENTELTATAAEMYDTAQNQAIRLENSFNNLKIAIGDALTPALVELADSATTVITVLSEAADKAPWLIQAILTPGQYIKGLFDDFSGAKPGVYEFAGAMDKAAGSANSLHDALRGPAESLQETAAAAEEAGQAIEDAGQQIEYSEAQTEELTKGTLELSGAQDTLTKALKEQTEAGSLSVKTAMSLIDAGYGAALAIDQETGAVTLNKDRYVELASAKINDQIASLETQRQAQITAAKVAAEAMAALGGGRAYYELAAAKLYAEKSDTSAIDVQIANLERLRANLGNVSAEVVSTSKQARTQAQLDLDEYKRLKAALDHQRALEMVDQETYYRKLGEYRDRYLTDQANLSQYNQVTEAIYKYDKALVEDERKLWAQQWEDYEKELQKGTEKILSWYGLFDEAPERQKVSGEALLENLRGQVEDIAGFFDKLSVLAEREGVGRALVEEIQAMGPSAMAELDALLALSDEKLSEYAALFEEKQGVAEQYAAIDLSGMRQSLTELGTELAEQLEMDMDELYRLCGQEAPEIGFSFAQMVAEGIESGLAEVHQAAWSIGSAAAEAVRSGMGNAFSLGGGDFLGTVGNQMSAAFGQFQVQVNGGGQEEAAASLLTEAVNAMAAMVGSLQIPAEITITTRDGIELARAFLPDIRTADRETPEVKSDV